MRTPMIPSDWLQYRRKSGLIFPNIKRTQRSSNASVDKPPYPENSILLESQMDGILFPIRNHFVDILSKNQRGRKTSRKARFFQRVTYYLQSFYEKSRLHYIVPIVILMAYSVLGGFIFYSIESPEEAKVLERKKQYLDSEEENILKEILSVEQRVRALFEFYNNTELRNEKLRSYKSFAMNRIYKVIYWYVLQVYYLNDQESYKASLLHPSNPERIWRKHYSNTFGRIYALRNYTQQLSERCWEIGLDMNSTTSARVQLKASIKLFNEWTGLQHVLTPTWTFWNSMFLAVTTYTTIGYGNITAKSKLGKLAAMIYAVIGIPLVLMILHKLGRFFLLCLQQLWNFLVWLIGFVSCVKNAEKYKEKLSSEERQLNDGSMPVLLAIGVAGGWMFLCAAIFLKFEKDWDYFKSFYFFFCSLTTIGYGDVTPTNSEDMFVIFGFIIIGLSLLKLEELFEELLLAMIEDEIPAGQQVKMGVFDLWKMWKRKQQRERKTKVPKETVVRNRQYLSNLRRIIPFAKRRREVLLSQFHSRLRMLNKSTQTDFYLVYELHHLNSTKEMDELSDMTGEMSDSMNSSSIPITSSSSVSYGSGSYSYPGSYKPLKVKLSDVHGYSSPSSKPSVTIHGCSSTSASSSSYARRYLPSRGDRHPTPNSTSVQSAPASVHSVRSLDRASTPNQWEKAAGTRRWTFFEIGKTPRGYPRGLVVPYMYLKKQSKTQETTEMRRLIAELDSRLAACRSLLTPNPKSEVSRSPSNRSSRRRSPFLGTPGADL